MYELDASRPETLYNASPPETCEWFQKELDKLGGKQLDGTPNLRVVWGQTERKFACGQMRVKYPTNFVAEKEDYHFRLRNMETSEVTLCTYEAFMLTKRLYDAADPNNLLMPEYKVVRQIEWIGVPRWMIEQYIPVTLFRDSESNWERNRFNWWWNPETRRQEWTDINGPFPYRGRYEHFLTVKDHDGTHNGKYRPLASDLFTNIQAALKARDSFKPQSAEKEIEKFIAAKEAKLRKSEDELADEIADSLAPHVHRMYEDGHAAKVYLNFKDESESRLTQANGTQRNARPSRRPSQRSKRQTRRKAKS